MAEHAREVEQRDDTGRDEPGAHVRRPLFPLESRRAERRERGRGERDDKENHARCARLAHVRHDVPPQLVERRGVAQGDQQEQDADGAQPPNQSPSVGISTKSEDREREHGKAEILGVEFERVGAPIRLQRSAPCESRNEKLGHMIPRDAVRCRAFERA